MTDTSAGRNGRPGSFGETVATDLASGRAMDLAELYALDAVTAEERREIDAYVAAASDAERASFHERVRQSRETLALTFRVEEQPPVDLFDRIMAKLPAQESLPPQETAPTVVPSVIAPTPEPLDELAQARQRRAERKPSATRRWLVGVAAAAAIALGGVGVGSYIADQNDPLNQVVRATDMREASVNVTGGGTATVRISSSHNAAVVEMKDVPAPPSGKVYQMWLIPKDGSAAVSQGLMDAEALSKPAIVNGIATASAIGITVEPVGGSQSPTFPVVAAAPLGA